MEGSAGIVRDGTRGILDADEVGGRGGDGSPYDRGGMKYAQAIISQTRDGSWKLTLQSDRQVEMMLEADSLQEIIKELKFAATREWTRREKI
jgi:hypothetical protein